MSSPRLTIWMTCVALASLLMGIAGTSVLRASSLRSSQQQEERTERVEELSLDARRSHDRRVAPGDGRVTFAATNPGKTCWDRFSLANSRPADGHRLPNGLLAPLTC